MALSITVRNYKNLYPSNSIIQFNLRFNGHYNRDFEKILEVNDSGISVTLNSEYECPGILVDSVMDY